TNGLPLIRAIEKGSDDARVIVAGGSYFCNPLRVGIAESYQAGKSAAVNVAERQDARSSRHVEPERRTRQRDDTIIEVLHHGESRSAASDNRNGIHAAEIVVVLVPGVQVHQK